MGTKYINKAKKMCVCFGLICLILKGDLVSLFSCVEGIQEPFYLDSVGDRTVLPSPQSNLQRFCHLVHILHIQFSPPTSRERSVSVYLAILGQFM